MRKWKIAAAVLLAVFASNVVLAQRFVTLATVTTLLHFPLQTLAGLNLTPLNATGASQSFQSYWQTVNISDYGAVCDGSTNDTAAIQAAIDAAFAANIQDIYAPGKCKFTPPLFLDPPGNLRGADGTHGQTYSAGTTYSMGQTVNSGGIAYISLINGNVGNTPVSSPSDWQVYLYNAGTTYGAGAIVSSGGVPWLSLQGSNTGNTPSLGSAFWQSWTATPYNFGFTTCLKGGEANPIGGLPGVLVATSNAAPGLWIGPGDGMCVKGITVRGPSNGTTGQQNPNGIGIAIAGGNGGASKTTLTDVSVSNFYYCFQAGVNNPQLAEDNVFINPVCTNAWIGFDFENQADVNLILNGNVQATIGVRSTTPLTTVIGGEWGTSLVANSFSISSISSVTSATCPERGGANCYSFSFTVASPDSHWPTQTFALWSGSTTYAAGNIVSFAPTSGAGDPSIVRLWQSLQGSNTNNQPALNSAFWIPVAGQSNYDALSIVTTGFGVIPLELTGWNTSTGVATVTTFTPWAVFYFNNIAALSSTDLQTEIQAATTVYAAEHQFFFQGSGFHARDIWTQPGAPICLTVLEDYGGTSGNKIEFLHYDDDPGWTQYGPTKSPTQPQLSGYYCIHSFPFIYQTTGGITIDLENILASPQNPPGDPIIFDIDGTGSSPLTVKNSTITFSPTMRTTGQARNTAPLSGGNGLLNYTPALGSFEWNVDPFMPRNNTAQSAMAFYKTGSVATPFSGFNPARWATPRTTTTILGDWQSPGSLGAYPPMWGNLPYGVMNWNSGTLTHLWAVSAHSFASWGQNLTTSNISGLSWSYTGGGFAVQLDANTMGWMFPGLVIGLNNGSGNVNYMVTGVEPGLGYVTVFSLASDAYSASNLLAGTAGTTYTGTTISQQSFSITQY